MSLLQGIHHAAYRCRDAKQTIEFYREALGMDLMLAISEDRVPSTKEPDPYMHIFLDAGAGNVLAFFEIPNSPPMGRDENTPAWVQHIAFRVADMDTLLATRERLKSLGIEVLGPTNHEMFQSIYFVDPNGHRIELAADIPWNPACWRNCTDWPARWSRNGAAPAAPSAMPPSCTRRNSPPDTDWQARAATT
ncbi:VOC family protein [Azotobacter chroococcum]|uniref:VOC family protein n=1 Tax=Azotobacter chroococcum TaxID=353 RepID=UPI001E4851CA|nr:VOC family protein [Azotobacter chroococcum]